MKNILSSDSSPYLLQHKNNPVHWQIWSKDIFDLSKKEKKPILLSVGYASCHWCHVMAHESFEDIETAELMNKFFINVKVDREERPDIDFIFQSSFQLFNNASGGWPLTMFLDENGVPFMGGTYFPKEEKHGLPSFKVVLKKVAETYTSQRKKIIAQKNLITQSLELKKSAVVSQDLIQILDKTIEKLDSVNGGYKGAPKFPTFNIFDTFLYFYNKTKNKKYFDPVNLILKKLCSQGIYDHVEGGISRYTIDENWLIPHFEKMLYDNAQFVSLLSKFSKIHPDDYFKNKIKQTIAFINKNFVNTKEQLLGSALDADSEGKEGKYYIFNYTDIKTIENVSKYFDIKPEGNWEGKIILKEISAPPKNIINELYELRKKNKKPFFDNKIQTDLNSLWISSLISAHLVMPEEGYLKQAENIYLNMEKLIYNGNIFHTNSKKFVFLEDYAYLINCLIDLYEITLNPSYRLKAQEYTKYVIENFYLKEKKIFQKNLIHKNDLFINPIDIGDHTISNGNSIMLMNFTRLGFEKNAKDLSQSIFGYLNTHGAYMISSVKSLDFYQEVAQGKKCSIDGC